MSTKDTINWALVGTGGICNNFLAGLRATGGQAAAVVSRCREKAQDFAARNSIAKAFDHYDHMLEDTAIDVVYIGTPHTTHKDLAVRALKARKAVVCEKPAAINAGELQEIIAAARENNVFFMEAMWTRFTPPLQKVREWLTQGLIGEIKMVQANFGFNAHYDPKGRLFDPHLGGGALLDVGIYPLSLISMVFGGKKPLDIKSQLYFGETGVDEEDAIILSYGGNRIAFAAAAIRTELANDAWIYGTRGKIHIPYFIWARSARLLADGTDECFYQPEFISNGYNYEAEAVMDCIREAQTESPVMPWNESMVIMETMDTIRAQWHFRYPSETHY
ncbi:MAG: Gfo/Idh/MocA family oxidoreductase [Treponema sp.]|nr:Gfo/Idh/MocA family oxidoreductase [Treponema sp.]